MTFLSHLAGPNNSDNFPNRKDENEKRINNLNELGNLSMSISKSDIDNLNKKFTHYSPINTRSNIVKTKINILGREINEENPPFGSYINRPYVDFNPKMELYELEPEDYEITIGAFESFENQIRNTIECGEDLLKSIS